MKKYKLRKDLIKQHDGRTLYRIEALKDFGEVNKGDIGGFVENEDNLSQYGYCWIFDDAIACDSANVSHNATLRDRAIARGSAIVREDAIVCDYAMACDDSVVRNSAMVCDVAIVSDCAMACDDSVVRGRAVVRDRSIVRDRAFFCGSAIACDHDVVHGSSMIVRDKINNNDKENKDSIKSPDHYKVAGIESIDILKDLLTREEFIGFLKGNILKYNIRSSKKGQMLSDYKKMRVYSDWLIELLEGEEGVFGE